MINHLWNPDATLVDILKKHAQQRPQHCCLIFTDGENEYRRLNYQELNQEVTRVAQNISQHAKPGDRAFLLYESLDQFLISFLGCFYSGVVAVPTFPPSESRDLRRLLAISKDAEANVLLSEKQILPQIEKSGFFNEIKKIATDENKAQGSGTLYSVQPSDLAFLQYTSGSTAMPRGVMVSHGNLVSNLAMIATNFRASPQTVWVSWLPLFHDMGLVGGALDPLFCGGTAVLMSPLDFLQKPARWLRSVSQYSATITGAPNFAYDLAVRRSKDEELAGINLSTLKVVFNGAEPVRQDTMSRFTDKFSAFGLDPNSVIPVYGLAESTLMVSGGPAGTGVKCQLASREALESENQLTAPKNNKDSRFVVSCGVAVPGQEIVIVDPEKNSLLKDGNIGEIWVTGPNVAQGYWKNKEQTLATFHAKLQNRPGELFLRTGDLGTLKAGELFICGRKKDLIIVNGRNYYPQDLEIIAEQASPQVRKGCVAVFAIEGDRENHIAIVAETKSVSSNEGSQVAEAIRSAVSQQLNLPVNQIALIKEKTIPKTSSGKIQRSLSRKLLLNGELKCHFSWEEGQIKRESSTSESREKSELISIIEEQRLLLSRTEGLLKRLEPKMTAADVKPNVEFVSDDRAKKEETPQEEKSKPQASILDNLENELIALFAKTMNLPKEKINSETLLTSYGIDSVAAYEFYAEISEKYEVKLPRRVLFDHPTIKSISKLVSSRQL